MDTSTQERVYPGETASAYQVVRLAHQYYHAAMTLFLKDEGMEPISLAPARLCAIHAIELYLNAMLRHQGVDPALIRGRMHNLADPTFVDLLKLRKKTAAHLEALTARREYLIARYAPEQKSAHTELNRLTATLVEVMTKAGRYASQPIGNGATL